MKPATKLLALFVCVSLFALFSYSKISVSAENDDIESLKQKITELEKRIKDLEAILKIYHAPEKKESDETYGWLNNKSWRNLRKGMSEDEVKNLLGEPLKTVGGSKTIWYYPNFYRNYVSFDEKGNLTGWIEP